MHVFFNKDVFYFVSNVFIIEMKIICIFIEKYRKIFRYFLCQLPILNEFGLAWF